jgi:hypothetical protein
MHPPLIEKETDCILCRLPAQFTPTTGPVTLVCPRCGRFQVTMEFAQDIRADETIQPYLSAATRQASQRGRPIRLQTDNYIAFAWRRVRVHCPCDAPRQRQAALFGECRTRPDGTCQILGITPGEYHVYAFPAAGCFPTRDLETVGRFALAFCPTGAERTANAGSS